MPKPNPYCRKGQWYYYDETGDEHGPFKNEHVALRELCKYCKYLNDGPTLWQAAWWPIKRGFKSIVGSIKRLKP